MNRYTGRGRCDKWVMNSRSFLHNRQVNVEIYTFFILKTTGSSERTDERFSVPLDFADFFFYRNVIPSYKKAYRFFILIVRSPGVLRTNRGNGPVNFSTIRSSIARTVFSARPGHNTIRNRCLRRRDRARAHNFGNFPDFY